MRKWGFTNLATLTEQGYKRARICGHVGLCTQVQHITDLTTHRTGQGGEGSQPESASWWGTMKINEKMWFNQMMQSQALWTEVTCSLQSKHRQESPGWNFQVNLVLCLCFIGEVHVEGQEHFYMETQTILAIPQEEDKEMVIHLGTQFQTHVQVTEYFWKMRLQMAVWQRPLQPGFPL